MSIATAGIRLAEMAEAESISHLSRDTIEAGLPWRWQPADIERFMRSTRHNVIVAEETSLDTPPPDATSPDPELRHSAQPALRDGQVRSGCAVRGYGDNDAYLALLSVRPEWRRRSIARAMVEWLMKCAEVGGVKRVDVELRADNSAALALYQSLQFTEIARKPGGYYGTVTQVRMRRVLRR